VSLQKAAYIIASRLNFLILPSVSIIFGCRCCSSQVLLGLGFCLEHKFVDNITRISSSRKYGCL